MYVSEPSGTSTAARAGWLLFAVLVFAECAWILSLPVFPSQDGPAHVYYAKVARDLLQGHSTYASDYRIARLFPPYSIHAYFLIAVRAFVPGEMAEKLLACFTVLVDAFGFAFFARQLGKRAALMAALAAPFFLNRFLFLGFYGYEIGVGFALLAMAVWMRSDRRQPTRRVAFLLLTATTLFSHPVPYLIVIAFCWTEVLAGWWNSRADHAHAIEGEILRPTRADVAVLSAATSLLFYVKHYSHSGMLWNYELLADAHDKLMRIVDVFRTTAELPLKVTSYNAVLAVVLISITIVSCIQAIRESRQGTITRTQIVVGWAFLILIALPFLPRTMNGSGFFADRFSIWPPLLLLAAASSAIRGLVRSIPLAAVAVLVLSVGMLDAHLGPVAEKIDVSSFSAPELEGLHASWRSEHLYATDLTFDPYILSEIRLIDRAGAILIGAPWMDLQIMMLEEIKTVMPSGAVIERCNGAPDPPKEYLLPGYFRFHTYGCFEVREPTRRR